ncbi:RNB domain-containing ribonuclease [Psittacicella hinzii]|uniref:RNB domain-containing protein n=1 Tax=Psittacicella hinzii TaxID=2028575 RepID=A0A3A1YB63_9GAMM|nr:RNB domain-containing ribonuclease [Psittacicella hinzii]RIY35372.1 hypothetical protein CKF58_06720 [Psittacicella hinzii]
MLKDNKSLLELKKQLSEQKKSSPQEGKGRALLNKSKEEKNKFYAKKAKGVNPFAQGIETVSFISGDDKVHYLSNDHITNNQLDNRSYPLCDCKDHEQLKESSYYLCAGKTCTCVHDNKHRLNHTLYVGIIRVHEKGFGFIEQGEQRVYVANNAASLVLDQCTVAYTIGKTKRSLIGHIKTVISHPYTRCVAKVVNLNPLQIILSDDPTKQTFNASLASDIAAKDEIALDSVVIVTVDDINAKINDVNANFTFTINDYVCSYQDPLHQWHEKLQQNLLPSVDDTITEPQIDRNAQERVDLTAIPFISIDSEKTQDVDDLVYLYTISEQDKIVTSEDLTKLTSAAILTQSKVAHSYEFAQECAFNAAKLLVPEHTQHILAIAIADPGALFNFDDVVDQRAQALTQTLYLPAFTVDMLPTKITATSSLLENGNKPGLVGFIYLAADYEVLGSEFRLATINNHAKLNYEQVSAYITKQLVNPEQTFANHQLAPSHIIALIDRLYKFHLGRLAWRDLHQRTVNYSTTNTDYIIDENSECVDIILNQFSISHEVISECMLLINSCAGSFYKQFGIPAIYNQQHGIKANNLNYFSEYLKYLVEDKDMHDLVPYLDKYHAELSDCEKLELFHAILQIVSKYNDVYVSRILRFMDNSDFTLEPQVHIGLGTEAYINFSSPIRRYTDIINQHNLKSFLLKQPYKLISNELLEKLNTLRVNIKNIAKELAVILETQYLNKKLNQSFTAEIVSIINSGIRIKLIDSGINGFIYTYRLEDKVDSISINSNAMEITLNGKLFTIKDKIDVTLQRVENGKYIFNWNEFTKK